MIERQFDRHASYRPARKALISTAQIRAVIGKILEVRDVTKVNARGDEAIAGKIRRVARRRRSLLLPAATLNLPLKSGRW
jgi:hypothetical protein